MPTPAAVPASPDGLAPAVVSVSPDASAQAVPSACPEATHPVGPPASPEVTALADRMPEEETTAPAAPRPSRSLRRHLGTLAGLLILGVLVWRLGTGASLDGLRRIDLTALLAAVALGALTTAASAWRWTLVARALRIRLPLGAAVADYYRALFLNAALPGGVLGDVHRAVRHGRSAGDLGRGVRAVVLERTAGQLALAAAGAGVLLVVDSPVRADVRRLVPLAALAAAGVLAVVLALRLSRTPGRAPHRAAERTASPRARALRAALAEAREGLLSRRNGPGVAASSLVVLAGHVATFFVAARVAGSGAPFTALLPLAVLALLAMGLPLNVGGFGPREGVTAWAFGAAGLGAGTGLATAVVYGVLCLAAALPGAVVLVARWWGDMRQAASGPSPVSSARVAPKASTRLASSAFPLSAEPREGRPMTPESV
ncbi:flippase-like domain-containing protein [Streptomyces actuosus]|nr:flippase-like domain-containing protein [Streptomyces actuosus]